MDRTFQVDLRGVVDLLSHHLYGSPRVYVRELMQNAVDAITARRAAEPDAPALVRIEPPELTGDGTLRVHDTGIGLTEEQVHELLATIGRSSKRDELGFSRHEFLGQFGIGLLSCFLVADEIRVVTRNGDHPTVLWTGYADGRYAVRLAPPQEARAEVGTTVTLVPRHDADQWYATSTVTELARLYGSLLPVTVRVGSVVTTTGEPPWPTSPGATVDRAALIAYARETLGVDPFDVVPLRAPEAGLTGVAFILPTAVNPAARAGHRVYLKRMLLTEHADGLLPDWAFFAHCVIDTSELRPTASREALYEDSLLTSTRESLGAQIRGWLVRLAKHQPHRLAEFLQVHHLGVKALALHDDEMLNLVDQWWPMDTNVGTLTLAEFRQRYGLVRYAASLDEFRQLAAVAAAQDLAVVNGGYTYDSELIERLPTVDRTVLIERLEPSDLTTRFDALEPHVELALRPFLTAAGRALERLGCEVLIRAYDPASLPALYLLSRSAAFTDQLAASRDKADELWGGVLDALAASAPADRPQLVLNHRNPLVRRITALGDPELVGLAVEALYGQALLLGHHPIRAADAALLNSSFLGLLGRAVPGQE
ncbi:MULTISPECIES: HSP90 family protein [unclassified Micromonospora]|uniref:HSP90 family protein n=1 Tax=unclassified Micromonospora TaxID=2617518 RepID=UPI0010352D4F|nr:MULTISPECIES: HSP90 family protein [unclassified Micromonospora]QKW11349.1 HSP90 family protein [Verrucosispora sp. NA02020]TBL34654.1 HSP90 family protein [Verrucosispora sp. SN26_14.1]